MARIQLAEASEKSPNRDSQTKAEPIGKQHEKAAPVPGANGVSALNRLDRLLTKELGTVDDRTAEANPNEIEVLRGVCQRVVLSERGNLACEGCPECWNADTVEASAVVPGNFLMGASDEAIVAMYESGWNYRYFVLTKDDGRWRVHGAVVLQGLPVEHRRLRVSGREDILVRKVVEAGAPRPTAVDAVRFAPDEVQVTSLMVDSRPFDACAPSDYALRSIQSHDINSDRIEDIILSVHDFSGALLKPDAQEKLQRACAEQSTFRPSSSVRNLTFVCDGDSFIPNEQTAKLLHLDEGPVASEHLLWEVSASY